MKSIEALQILFPTASSVEKNELELSFLNQTKVIEAPENSLLFSPGDSCENYLFLLKGQVKVFSTASNGREILLYRIKPGETCILSTNCMMGSQYYPASAITETVCQALSVPVASLREAMSQSPLINWLLMDNLSKRIGCLIELVSEVALERLDVRLARHLLQLCAQKREVNATHEELAKEVGTAREVISRQLRKFEDEGWIETTRGRIHILQYTSLEALAEGFFC